MLIVFLFHGRMNASKLKHWHSNIHFVVWKMMHCTVSQNTVDDNTGKMRQLLHALQHRCLKFWYHHWKKINFWSSECLMGWIDVQVSAVFFFILLDYNRKNKTSLNWASCAENMEFGPLRIKKYMKAKQTFFFFFFCTHTLYKGCWVSWDSQLMSIRKNTVFSHDLALYLTWKSGGQSRLPKSFHFQVNVLLHTCMHRLTNYVVIYPAPLKLKAESNQILRHWAE